MDIYQQQAKLGTAQLFFSSSNSFQNPSPLVRKIQEHILEIIYNPDMGNHSKFKSFVNDVIIEAHGFPQKPQIEDIDDFDFGEIFEKDYRESVADYISAAVKKLKKAASSSMSDFDKRDLQTLKDKEIELLVRFTNLHLNLYKESNSQEPRSNTNNDEETRNKISDFSRK